MKGIAIGGTIVATALSLLAAANWPDEQLAEGVVASRVEVIKHRRILRLYAGDRVLKEYSVALGGEPIGHKLREGDERTPEGIYTLDYRNRHSAFHRSVHISYPSPADQLRAGTNGVDPGGMIMIHGLPNKLGWVGRLHRLFDWTDGCIAVTNPEMDEISSAVPDGTRIEIKP